MSGKRGGKPQKFAARHRGRELAAQFIYSMETYPVRDVETALELFMGEGSVAEADTPEAKEYCRYLVRGALERRSEIDELLLRVVTGWRPDRMVAMDRAVLRVTIFEGFLKQELPVKSAIAEAVEIAGTFGTKDSARFVNGVLARVTKAMSASVPVTEPQDKAQDKE